MINLLEKIIINNSSSILSLQIDSSFDQVYQLDCSLIKQEKIEIELLENASLTLVNVINASKKIVFNLANHSKLTFNLASFEEDFSNEVTVNMDENSEFQGAFADFSHGKSGFKLTTNLFGSEARAHWHLATLTKENDKKDFDISFFHHARNTYAKMENYGVCEDSSSLSFFGSSRILKGAKESATHQSAKIMVFDQKCSAKASPTLCIDENDVLASHAAVVGQINEDHIFYLTSRGIEEKEAKKLITLGYLTPILKYFKSEEVVDLIKNQIETRV